MTPPALSVVVCTRNRAALLDDCLAALVAQDPPGGMEVVVVDNGSTDATPAVVARWVAHTSSLRSLVEPVPGLAHARNTGVHATQGRVVAFVDDDATARAGWAAAVLAAFGDHPDAVVVAGRVELRFDADPPRWFTPRFASWYSALDLGPEPIEVGPGQWVVGANLAMRRDDVVRVGGFRHDLGRRAGTLIGNEELELIDRLRTHGSVRYEPRAVVDHLVLPDRLRLRWLLVRAFDQGRSDVRAGAVGRRDRIVAMRRLVSGWRTTARRLRTGPFTEQAIADTVARARRLGEVVELSRRSGRRR